MQPALIDTAPRFDGADVTDADHLRLGKQLARVLAVMADGEWHTVDDIAAAIWLRDGIKDPETSISAQLRNARKVKHGGHQVERVRTGNYSSYRLVNHA